MIYPLYFVYNILWTQSCNPLYTPGVGPASTTEEVCKGNSRIIIIHSNAWYYNNKQRRKFITSVKINAYSDSYALLK